MLFSILVPQKYLMRKTLTVFALSVFILSCGEKKETKNAIDLSNKGVGPIKFVTFTDKIDDELAAQGEEKFEAICTACHLADQRMIGPALSKIYERRSPEWVMNMIMNPDGMIKEDPIAKALSKEYNNSAMTNQNLTENEARSIAEYLRTL